MQWVVLRLVQTNGFLCRLYNVCTSTLWSSANECVDKINFYAFADMIT